MRTVNSAGVRPWLWSVGTVLLALAFFGVLTAARISRYCPDQGLRPQFSSAVKINQARVQSSGEVTVEVVTRLQPDRTPYRLYRPAPDVAPPRAFAICRPFHFRPPPSLSNPAD